MIPELIMLFGAALILLAAIGVVRFDDTLNRMHAQTKATVLGIVMLLLGGALALIEVQDITALLLAAVLQLLTTPVSGHLSGRAAYRSRRIDARVDVVDELSDSADSDQLS